MLQRMQVAFDSLLEQLEEYRFDSELVLVDWNPPVDRPLLKDVISWPDRLEYCTIRSIVVPPSVHRRYKGAEALPLYWSVATNVGVRRSRGQFVLVATAGLLYSNEMIEYFASRALKPDRIYRTDRCGVDRAVSDCATREERLNFSKTHVLYIQSRRPSGDSTIPNLHTRGAGDFLLLSRDQWQRLHGVPEIDIPSARVDGLLCYMAYAAGLAEVVLEEPMRLYHIDHDNKWGTRREEVGNWVYKALSSSLIPRPLRDVGLRVARRIMPGVIRTELRGVRTLSTWEYHRLRREIVTGKRSYTYNDESWGLGNDSLEEYVITAAAWDECGDPVGQA